MFTDTPQPEKKPNKHVFICYDCKLSYKDCKCYAICPKCHCAYRVLNPCNSKTCK